MLYLNYLILTINLEKIPNVQNINIVDRVEYQAKKSSPNNYLSEVNFQDVTFEFKKDNTNYVIEVPYSKSKLDLTYKKENESSQVEVIGNEELYVGNNSLVLAVKDENNNKREYKFTIIRLPDTVNIKNDIDSLKEGLLASNSKNINIDVENFAIKINKSLASALKASDKNITFNWKDTAGNITSSLTIDGKNMENTEEINPNFQADILNTKLQELLKNREYISLNTTNTNIPKQSIYKTKIDAKEENYYLCYYENDTLYKKNLRVVDDTVEFEIESNKDYAIVAKSDIPSEFTPKKLHWLWITLFIIILFVVFFFITKLTALKFVQQKNSKN